MKHVATKFLMLLLLLFSSAPQINAVDVNDQTGSYTLSTTVEWGSQTSMNDEIATHVYTSDGSAYYDYYPKQFAVINQVSYVALPQGNIHNITNGILGWTDGPKDPKDPKMGYAITTDDAKNLIYAPDIHYEAKITKVRVKNVLAGGVSKDIDLSSVYTHKLRGWEKWGNVGQTDFMHASGDCFDGTGYLWLTDGENVVRITIENVDGTQTATRQDVYPVKYSTAFSLADQNYNDCRFVPYSGGRYFLQTPIGIYDCVIENGSVVPSKLTGDTLLGCDIIYFMGYKLMVSNTSISNRNGRIEVKDLSSGEAYVNCPTIVALNAFTGEADTSIESFPDANTGSGHYTGNSVTINAFCKFEIDENDPTKLHLNTYIPSIGFARFVINATRKNDNPITMVTATLHKHDGHQDAEITWDVDNITNHASTQYKVYYRLNPYIYGEDGTNKQIDFDNWSGWRELGTTDAGATTYTHSDVKYLNHGTEFYKRTYQYKVVPADGNEYVNNETLGSVTPEWISASPKWMTYHEKKGVVHYDGYQKVQMFWEYDGYGNQPTSYDVYRDDVKITPTPLQLFVHVDYDATPNRDHTYYIMANYDGMTIDGEPIEGGKSEPITVLVTKRDEAKPLYKLEEVYNYRIGSGEGKVNPQSGYSKLASTPDDYRQGAYFRGNWYIAQRQNDSGGPGGIIKISSEEPALNPTNNILTPGTKYKTFSTAASNVGIGIDDYGNIFVRYGTDAFSNTFTQGNVLRAVYRDPQGNDLSDNSVAGAYLAGHSEYGEAYVADFSSLPFVDNLGSTFTGLQYRCDYYSMSGNVFGEGAILYMAPTNYKTIFRINLKGDATGTFSYSALDAYTISGVSSSTGKEFVGGVENYGFGVDGRTDYVFNLRSNGYFNIGVTEDDPTGGQIPIYESLSRVNNAGGCTQQFNGELFIVTPQSQYSKNPGNFYVGIGDREVIGTTADGKNIFEGAEGADLNNIVPIATVVQNELSDASYGNSNGNWMYAELGRIDGTELWPGKILTIYTKDANGQDVATEVTITKENINQYAECMFIYQYIPGIRFAKYRITATNTFPTPEVTVKVFPVYKDANGNELHRDTESGAVPEDAIELDRFDGVVTFPLIQGYGTSGNDNAYEIEGYRLTLFDKYGNVVYPVEGWDNDGVVDGIINLPHSDKTLFYTIPYSDLERTEDNSYTAEIVTVFKGASGYTEGNVHESVPVIAEDDNTYVPMAPNGKAIAYRSLEWGDWDADMGGKPSFDKDGNPYLPDENDAYWDVYQISMNVEEPNFTYTGMNEPVSYYTIHVAKTTDGETWTDKFDIDADVESAWVRDVMLYVGKGGELDGVQADEFGYVDCGALYGGKIPGTYTFKSIEDSPKDYPDVYWFEKYFMMRGDEATDVVYKDVIPDLINDRKYYVVAHYAAGTPKKIQEVDPIEPASAKVMAVAASAEDGNSKIYAQRHAELTAAVEYENIPTGVEDIELTAKVSVYPIPATVSITIKSAEVIENVEIYSLAGVNVKAFECNGEQVMTVAVDDLAAGYYMLKVNGYAPIKFLKK